MSDRTAPRRPPPGSPLVRWGFVGLTLLAGAASALVAVTQVAPTSEAARAISNLLPVVQPGLDYAEATANLPRGAGNLPLAAAAADKASALAPDRLRATLVRMDVRVAANGGRFDPATLALLDQSYRLSPFDLTYGPGRMTFAYNRWSQLTPDLRGKVYRETDCLNAAARIQLADGLRINDRLGALAYALNVRRAERGKVRCVAPY